MNHIEVHKRQCLAQIDVSNAFGTVSRARVLEAVESTGTLVGPLVRRWLASKQYGRVAISHDENLLLPTQTGVPQGDPLSAVLYSLPMERRSKGPLKDQSLLKWQNSSRSPRTTGPT